MIINHENINAEICDRSLINGLNGDARTSSIQIGQTSNQGSSLCSSTVFSFDKDFYKFDLFLYAFSFILIPTLYVFFVYRN